MGNSLRCCLACVLPCGALDLIRIVHMNGFVEEITGPITADDVLKANPNHILSKPTAQGLVRRIDIISPESELKRGSIYFLIPSTTSRPRGHKAENKLQQHTTTTTGSSTTVDIKRSGLEGNSHLSSFREVEVAVLGKISKSKSSSSFSSSRRENRRPRSGRIDVWRPHLQSISED